MRAERLAVLAVCGCLVPAWMMAAERPATTFNELAHRLSEGNRIAVAVTDAHTVEGRLSKLASDSLELQLADGSVLALSEKEVVSVAKRGDKLWNGILIGAAVGVAGWPMCRTETKSECRLGAVTTGALIGGLIDLAHKGRRVVYERGRARARLRVRPALGKRQWGLVLTMEF